MTVPASAAVHEALAVPARRDILALLDAADAPLTAALIAERTALHVTTVRFHLEHLLRARLVDAAPLPRSGRGRPATGYRARYADPTATRERMVDALAQALTEPDLAASDAARAAGHRWSAELAVHPGEPLTTVRETFAHLGFDPVVEPGPAGGTDDRSGPVIDVVLRACPFRDAARRTPQAVCGVHAGLAQGLVARAADPTAPTRARVVPFVAPDRCLIRLSIDPRST